MPSKGTAISARSFLGLLVGAMSGLFADPVPSSGNFRFFGGLGETVPGARWVEAGAGGGRARLWPTATGLVARDTLTRAFAGLPERPVSCTGLPTRLPESPVRGLPARDVLPTGDAGRLTAFFGELTARLARWAAPDRLGEIAAGLAAREF